MHRYHSDFDAGDDLEREAGRYGHEAVSRAEAALETARRNARRMNERLTEQFEAARDEAAPALERWAHRASRIAHRGGRALREGSSQLRDRTVYASRTGVEIAREQPIKALLLAVGLVAAAAAVYGLIRRSR